MSVRFPLHRRLLEWYDAHARDLPWRNHPDPYAVWVSEIMLQQTQVATVRNYFDRFLSAFPTPAALAAAPMDRVLKAWEGLGYYARARRLHQAAQRVAQAGGALPVTAAQWAALPGVGPYTAAAIASICHGETTPVVDGNVARVFARYLAWSDDFTRPAARDRLVGWLRPHLRASRRAGDFNQAMMDLGATICAPRSPACPTCPLSGPCRARRAGKQRDYPARAARRALPVRVAVAIRVQDAKGRALLVQRPPDGLLGGLWELPSVEIQDGRAPEARDAVRLLRSQTGLAARQAQPAGVISHAFTHFKLNLHLFDIAPTWIKPSARALALINPDALPLTTTTRRALKPAARHPA